MFKLRKELLECDLERKSLLEDLYGIKQVQQENNRILRKQKEDIDRLTKESALYKEQSTIAISDRDAMAWEIESLQRDLEVAQDKVLKTSSALATVEEERDVLKQRLEESDSMVERLEKVAATAELLPMLQRDLRNAEQRSAQLETQVADLTRERDSLEGTLSREQKESSEAKTLMTKTHDKEVLDMTSRIQSLETDLEHTQHQLASVTSQKVQALVDKADAECLVTKREQELSSVRREMAVLKQNLETATREKVQALIDKADAEAQLSGSTSRVSSVSPSPLMSPVKKRLEL